MINQALYFKSFKFIFVLILFSLLVNSCKKDLRNSQNTRPGLSITEAQNFYNTSTSKSKQVMSIADGSGKNTEIQDIVTPVWNLADTTTDSLWYVVETPIVESLKKASVTNQIVGNDLVPLNKIPNGESRLVVVKNKVTGEIESAIMLLTAYTDAGALNLSRNTYKHKDPSFTGSVTFTTTDHKYINGWTFLNGKPSNKIRLKSAYIDSTATSINLTVPAKAHSPASGNKSAFSNRTNNLSTTRPLPIKNDGLDPTGGGGQSCGATITDNYYQVCISTSAGMVCGDWEYNYSTYEYTDCDQTGTNNSHYTQYEGQDSGQILSNLPPGAGGNAGSSNVITNLIKDPCLSEILNKVTKANYADTISKIIRNLNGNAKINITVTDVPTLTTSDGGDIDGVTENYTLVNGIFNCTIKINDAVAFNASEEYNASTIIHESLHAYIKYINGNAPALDMNHNDIANNYIKPFAGLLNKMYPSLSLKDATTLAWGGLMKTSLWKSSFAADTFTVGTNGTTMTYNELQGTLNGYHAGYLGTPPCKR